MRKLQLTSAYSIALLALFSLLSGCVKDTCRYSYTYTWFEPLYKTNEAVRANIKSNPAKDIQQPGKMVLMGHYIFLNELDKGIHVLDNSNPSSPKNIRFIDIPGNVDLAIKGNTLYADLYTDLVVLDISDPLNVVKKSIISGVFPQRYYGAAYLSADSAEIIYDWKRHDTTIMENCRDLRTIIPGGVLYFASASTSVQNGSSMSNPVGITGSMSRFAIVNNHLYAVDDENLNVFDISTPGNPVYDGQSMVDYHVETIYPFKDKLFIGSNNGTFIYDVSSSPASPAKAGEFTHARQCDPVIADDEYAYITLHSGTTCLGYDNQLDIVKLNNLTDASLVKTYPLTSPQGLSKDGSLLFICDGTDGLKVYDASDVQNLKLLKQFGNMETYDVITWNNVAIVIAQDGLYEYSYSDPNNIHLLGKINIAN
ncbi:MAG TPA: hypothetical protein VG847_11860 [Chitinophagaceae bacterium]|nr:hypothetical protein [Chitinophagaceae bacterium]